MKKFSLSAALLCMAFFLFGCQSEKPLYALNPSEIQSVYAFTGGVPAAAVKKEVTSAGDVKRIVETINQIEILRKGAEQDEVAGGIGIVLQFNGTDGKTQVISIGGDGALLRLNGVSYKITAIDCLELWDSLDYEEIEVGEDGLPPVPASENA